jgi:excisionase family DNA binding protein
VKQGRPPGRGVKAAEAQSEVMTIADLASDLHCHTSTIYRLVKQKDIPAFKLGSDWRFFRSDIDKWIKGRTG